ncbi:MAG: hypothetical protein H8E48_05560 [Chloroflexi bacterium]|nr:hypothetical protein [Chloroflexota bacterium]
MLTDWTLTSSAPWALQAEGGAMVIGDTANITYVRDHTYTRTVHQLDEAGELVLDENGDPVEIFETKDEAETRTTKHQRASFGGNAQTNTKWHANIKREIAADLADMNKSQNTGVDITNAVK